MSDEQISALVQAILFQHQRQKIGGKLLATPEDYELGRMIMEETVDNLAMLPVTTEQKELMDVLLKYFSVGGTVSEIQEKFHVWEERWLYTQLNKLAKSGFVRKENRHLDGVKKPVMHFIPIGGLFSFKIPSWNEINAINTNDASNTINTNDASNTINTNNKSEEGLIAQLALFELGTRSIFSDWQCAGCGMGLNPDFYPLNREGKLFCDECKVEGGRDGFGL